MLRSLLILLLVAVVAGLGWLLLAPTPVEPVAWVPDPPRTDLGINHALAPVHRVELGEAAHGPEDVAVASPGRAYIGLDDGRILVVNVDSGQQRLLAQTGGRPLGLDLDGAGQLIVADAARGLLQVDSASGEISVLSTTADGLAFGLVDDVEVAPDGRIFFTDASAKFPLDQYRLDVVESAGSGRLLVYDPVSRTTKTLMAGLMFANGVAVSADNRFVLVVETGRYRVWRLWLTGERAGQREVFVDGLPGFPDGISRGEDGLFWMSLAAPRSAILDGLAGQPLIRKMISRVPGRFMPGPRPWSYVLGVDGDGNIVHNLQQPDGLPVAYITSVQQYRDRLYLGSLHETAFGVYRLASAGGG